MKKSLHCTRQKLSNYFSGLPLFHWRNCYTIIFFITSILFSQASVAGELYGSVSKDGATITNASVSIVCSGFSGSVTTRKNGFYKFESNTIKVNSSCKVKVNNLGPIRVHLSESSTSANLDISNKKLKRR